MILLLTPRDSVDLVYTGDPAVKSTGEDHEWIERSEALSVDKGALTATVRTLTHREVLGCRSGDDSPEIALLNAGDLACLKIEGTGLNCDTAANLARLPITPRVALGAWVLSASTLPVDPTEPSGSE